MKVMNTVASVVLDVMDSTIMLFLLYNAAKLTTYLEIALIWVIVS
jgi:hypothetical protein